GKSRSLGIASEVFRRDEAVPLMRPARQPAEHVFGAYDGQWPGFERAVDCRKDREAAWAHQSGTLGDELRGVRNVLDDFQAGDDIEGAAFGDEVFDPLRALLGRQALRLGVAFRNCDIAFGWIDRRDFGTHSCQRFGDKSAATTDVESGETFARFQRFSIPGKMFDSLF